MAAELGRIGEVEALGATAGKVAITLAYFRSRRSTVGSGRKDLQNMARCMMSCAFREE